MFEPHSKHFILVIPHDGNEANFHVREKNEGDPHVVSFRVVYKVAGLDVWLWFLQNPAHLQNVNSVVNVDFSPAKPPLKIGGHND
jgi:hypothetical protein